MNKVQTYSSFNKGLKRKSRKEHLELCGYKLVSTLNPELGKPRDLALKRLNAKTELTGKHFDGVYIQDLKSMNGDIGYSLYAKEI